MVDSFIDERGNHKRVKVHNDISEKELKKYDCVILLTNHSQFDYKWYAKHSKVIFDTRNGFKGVTRKNIIKL